jgi:hypothetical protein
MFSSRLPDIFASNALSRSLDRLRAAGTPLLDLTETNPTAVGLSYPDDVLAPLSNPQASRYRPAPLGLQPARAAVAAATPGSSPDRIVLTASTSEAYSILFKLLCDPGQDVLVPQPSYPLLDLLTRLDAVPARPYRLDWHGRWSIDRASVERALTPSTRALVIVSPNNPTGSMLRRDDRAWIAGLAAERDLAIIADEVFSDYPLSPGPDACSMSGDARALTFTLGGLSKSAGLPQVKLGWMRVDGPFALVRDALARLEVIADTYLSVSTPVQVAAPQLIETGRVTGASIAHRIRDNMVELRRQLAGHPAITLLEPEGGWSAVLHVPATRSEEDLVLDLAETAHVVVHPGYFFDFDREAFLVVSLLPEPAVFAEAVGRVLPIAAGDGRS